MIEIIKKIFNFLSALPAFAGLFKKASVTGRIDPIETLEALSSISPGTKKVADTAMSAAVNGANVQDVASAIMNIGEIDIAGQKVNTKSLIPDLKKAGGICAGLAGMLEKMQHQSASEIVDFGEAASKTSNWKEILNQAK